MQQAELKCLAQRMSSMEFSLQELTSEVSMLKAKDKLAPPPGLDIQSSTNDDVQDVIVERISVLEKIFILVDWQQLEFTAQKLLKSQCLEPDAEESPSEPEVIADDESTRPSTDLQLDSCKLQALQFDEQADRKANPSEVGSGGGRPILGRPLDVVPRAFPTGPSGQQENLDVEKPSWCATEMKATDKKTGDEKVDSEAKPIQPEMWRAMSQAMEQMMMVLKEERSGQT